MQILVVPVAALLREQTRIVRVDDLDVVQLRFKTGAEIFEKPDPELSLFNSLFRRETYSLLFMRKLVDP